MRSFSVAFTYTDGRENGFTTTLRLKPGQYRLKFIVDDSWRCSKDIPTATDEDGTFVNWLEVDTAKTEEEAKAAWSMDDDFPSRPQGMLLLYSTKTGTDNQMTRILNGRP